MTATRQILATKLLAPLPTTTLVARPRFIDRLHDALRRPLTAVIAPPGFGKTTLVSSWIANVNPNGFAPIVLVLDDYHEISTPASHTNRAADEDKVFSLCQHD